MEDCFQKFYSGSRGSKRLGLLSSTQTSSNDNTQTSSNDKRNLFNEYRMRLGG
jgi:hypothetical protein